MLLSVVTPGPLFKLEVLIKFFFCCTLEWRLMNRSQKDRVAAEALSTRTSQCQHVKLVQNPQTVLTKTKLLALHISVEKSLVISIYWYRIKCPFHSQSLY